MREIGRDQVSDRSEFFKAGDQFFGKTRRRDEDQLAAGEPKDAHANRQAQTDDLVRPAVDCQTFSAACFGVSRGG